MKRMFSILMIVLFASLSACAQFNPQSLTPAPTAATITAVTTPQKPGEETTTPSAKATATAPASQPAAHMPPLNAGGWKRVGDMLLPFTFEVPAPWSTPEGMRCTWYPAGLSPELGRRLLGANMFFDDLYAAPDNQLLPANSAVQNRTPLLVSGASTWMYQVKLFNSLDGTSASAYETHVIIRRPDLKKAFVLYISAPTAEDRAAMEDVLLHAVQTISFQQ